MEREPRMEKKNLNPSLVKPTPHRFHGKFSLTAPSHSSGSWRLLCDSVSGTPLSPFSILLSSFFFLFSFFFFISQFTTPWPAFCLFFYLSFVFFFFGKSRVCFFFQFFIAFGQPPLYFLTWLKHFLHRHRKLHCIAIVLLLHNYSAIVPPLHSYITSITQS